MCRGRETCTEVTDRDTWHKNAPLPPPDWLRAHLPSFHESIRLAAKGEVSAARKALSEFPSEAAQKWCIEHGQVSGNFRYRLLGKPPHSPTRPGIGPRNPPPSLVKSVLERDRYHCRYCELPVIPRVILAAFASVVGASAFQFGRSNLERHGAALVSWAQFDHVVPFSQGGATDMSNIVTSCWACNFGKDSYELARIGITDPRSRKPLAVDWDGLRSLLPDLRRIASAEANSSRRPKD
jgi:hypothetical protein